MIWVVLEPVFLVALVVLVLSQVVIPPLIGKRFFWAFRKTEKNLLAKEAELMDANTELEARRLEKKIKEAKRAK